MPKPQGKNSKNSNGKNQSSTGSSASVHPIEWAIGMASGLLIAALLAYFGYQALSSDNRPPILVPTVENIEEVDGRYHVMVSLRNEGDDTAADVALRATISTPDGDTVESEIVFDYAPAGSLRRGAFVFSSDPSGGELDLRVIGYNKP